MKIVLTGITGNLGLELARQLLGEGNEIVPVIRADDIGMARTRLQAALGKDAEKIQDKDVILGDLEKDPPKTNIFTQTAVECVINAAGVVHFKESHGRNTAIANNVLKMADELHVPLYHVSTAFVWKPNGDATPRNDYEKDKQEAEAVTMKAAVPWCIVRPSILTGDSRTGAIANFTGYYMIIRAFLSAVSHSDGGIRFPFLTGRVNMIPVDLVAGRIIELVQSKANGIHFIANSKTVSAQFALEKGLRFFGIDKKISFMECSMEEYAGMELTDAERRLLGFLHNFEPYWKGEQEFPGKENSPGFETTDQYLETILRYAGSRW